MGIVNAGFDVHRRQITFDALDAESGEVKTGRIAATPEAVEHWVERFPGKEVHVALEAGTGWYFVVRALGRAGATPHLAEIAETRARRGSKRRAKTDRQDARWLRTLLSEGRLPEAWIPPDDICWLRMFTRLRKMLIDEATAWRQRLQATLFHFGLPTLPDGFEGDRALEWLERHELPQAARYRIELCLRMIERAKLELRPLDAELGREARRRPGCRALQERHFGIGPVAASVIVSELGDVSRLSRPRQAVRMAGLDVGVERSDGGSKLGKLTKQGAPQLRWALYEAAQMATRERSPDHPDYLRLRGRGLSHTRASLTIARKLARRSYHTLCELGAEALSPA